ncbi:MAG: isoprenylcysteine carboxylmethyltransferase family protein [Chlorobiaceae bacterium]|nr:isoprenylcysteine carboxylmethyltransferase family protein [Chlorobiaceae bacterium]
MEKRQERQNGQFGQRGELLLALQLLLMLGFVVVPPWPSEQDSVLFRSLAGFRWLMLTFCWISSLIFTLGGFLAIRKYLTPLPYPVEDNQLVTTGVFRLVRHPIYTGLLLAGAGWTIFTASAAHLLVSIVAALLLDHKASREEGWLRQRHPEYAEYALRTGKFIPKLRVGKRKQ